MTHTAGAAWTSRARPYGLVGLLVSLFVILAVAALLCILAAALAFAVAALVLGWQPALDHLAAMRPRGPEDSYLVRANVVIGLIAYAAISAAVLAAARFRGGPFWRDLLAWHAWHPFRAARLFWLALAATILYSLAANAIFTRYYPPSKDWVTLPKGPFWIALFVVLAVVMAPLTEELLFRGWLYTILRARLAPGTAHRNVMQQAASVFDEEAADALDRPVTSLRSIGVWISILATAALFALAHWEKSHLYALAVFPVGLVLGVCRERTNSLFASMTFHAVYNGAALATLALGW